MYRTAVLALAAAILLSGCALQPDAKYYDDLYFQVYRLRHALEPVGWYPYALSKPTRTDLQAGMTAFLEASKAHRGLSTYRLLELVNVKFGGGNIGGELGMDERTETSTLMKGFLDAFVYPSGYGHNDEYKRHHFQPDLAAIEQKAIDSLKDVK